MSQEVKKYQSMRGVSYSRLDNRPTDVIWINWALAIFNGISLTTGKCIKEVRIQSPLPVCQTSDAKMHVDILVQHGLIAVAACRHFTESKAKKSQMQVMVFEPTDNKLAYMLTLIYDTLGDHLTEGALQEQCQTAIDIYLRNHKPAKLEPENDPAPPPPPSPKTNKLDQLLSELAVLLAKIEIPDNPSSSFPEPILIDDKHTRLTYMALCLLVYEMQEEQLNPQNHDLGGLKTKLSQWAKKRNYPPSTILKGWEALRQMNLLATPGYTGCRPKSFTFHYVDFLDQDRGIPDVDPDRMVEENEEDNILTEEPTELETETSPI